MIKFSLDLSRRKFFVLPSSKSAIAILAIRKNDGVCNRLSRKSADSTSIFPKTVVNIRTAKPKHAAGEISRLVVWSDRVVEWNSVVVVNEFETLVMRIIGGTSNKFSSAIASVMKEH